MPSSPRSSISCGTCRIDWRPSRLLVGTLVALGLFAGIAVSASALSSPWRVALAILATSRGLWLAWRAANEPRIELTWDGAGTPAELRSTVARETLHDVTVEFRGPLVRLQGRDDDGATRRLLWWPDTLHPSARRSLVLASRSRGVADNPPPSMAA